MDFDLARSALRTSFTIIEPTGFYPIDAYEPKPRLNVDLVALSRIILRIILKDERKLPEVIKSLPYSEDLKLFLSQLIEENPEKRKFGNAQEALKALESPSLLISKTSKTEIKKPSIKEKKERNRKSYWKFLIIIKIKKRIRNYMIMKVY